MIGRLLINGVEVAVTDDQWLGETETEVPGMFDSPKIESGASFSITVETSPAETMGNFEIMRSMQGPHERKPLYLHVGRYSEGDALLGRALVTGEILGGNVARAYSWVGLKVSHAMPIFDETVTYVLVDAVDFGRLMGSGE